MHTISRNHEFAIVADEVSSVVVTYGMRCKRYNLQSLITFFYYTAKRCYYSMMGLSYFSNHNPVVESWPFEPNAM